MTTAIARNQRIVTNLQQSNTQKRLTTTGIARYQARPSGSGQIASNQTNRKVK